MSGIDVTIGLQVAPVTVETLHKAGAIMHEILEKHPDVRDECTRLMGLLMSMQQTGGPQE